MFEFCKLFQIFLKGIRKVLIFHFCLYLIFFPLFSVKVFAGSLPIEPVAGGVTFAPSSNNIPVLNITKPTSSGVSVNKFNDLNVGTEGLILNNLNLLNYNTSYRSELSGEHIEFNPNFRDGESAKIILNEVVSSNKTVFPVPPKFTGKRPITLLQIQME